MRTGCGPSLVDLQALLPDRANNMCGRNNFMIHADNRQANNTASNGCIIMSQATRRAIRAAGGGTLNVVR